MRGQRDEAALGRILEALTSDAKTAREVSRRAGVTATVLYRWRDRDERVAEGLARLAAQWGTGLRTDQRRRKRARAGDGPPVAADATQGPGVAKDEQRREDTLRRLEVLRDRADVPAKDQVAACKLLLETLRRAPAAPAQVQAEGKAPVAEVSPDEVVAKFRVVGQRRKA